MDGDGGQGGFGFSHLAGMPITVSFGVILLAALVLLVILRLVFADVKVGG